LVRSRCHGERGVQLRCAVPDLRIESGIELAVRRHRHGQPAVCRLRQPLPHCGVSSTPSRGPGHWPPPAHVEPEPDNLPQCRMQHLLRALPLPTAGRDARQLLRRWPSAERLNRKTCLPLVHQTCLAQLAVTREEKRRLDTVRPVLLGASAPGPARSPGFETSPRRVATVLGPLRPPIVVASQP
jgi:hypothetical protein